MNLEYVEQRCIKYLKQSNTPLVTFDALLKYCKSDSASADVNEKTLLEFLRNHNEIRILEGPGADAPIPQDAFEAAGLVLGRRIIHRDRVPTSHELKLLIKGQLDEMLKSIETALGNLSGAEDPKRKSELQTLLQRIHNLQNRVDNFA